MKVRNPKSVLLGLAQPEPCERSLMALHRAAMVGLAI
jgi:hypothetical protein